MSKGYNVLFLFLYVAFSGAVFFYMLYYYVPSDLGAHVQILISFLEIGGIPTPPVYYTLIYLLHFIMPYKEGYGLAALLVLTAVAFLKFIWSFDYLKSYCPTVEVRRIGLFTFGLMFFAPLTLFYYEGDIWYLGKFTSLIWHNSTTLLSLPFCVLLFHHTMRFLEDRSNDRLIKIGLILIFTILIKPSFAFAFLPALPITIWVIDQRWSSSFFASLIMMAPATAIIIVEKILIYNHHPIDAHLEKGLIGGIGIRPFFLWLYYSESPVWDVIASFLFPVSFIALRIRDLVKDVHFVFSSILILIGFLIYFSFIETGPRMMDGNFFWQVVLTLFVGELVLCKHLMIDCFGSGEQPMKCAHLSLKNKVLLLTFLLHVVGGVAYTMRIILTHNIL